MMQVQQDSYLSKIYELQNTIDALNMQLSANMAELRELIEACEKLNIKENDTFYLMCKETVRRSVHVDSFKKNFPSAYDILQTKELQSLRMEYGETMDEIAKNGLRSVRVKDAEDLVGKIPLASCVVLDVKKVYTAVKKSDY